MYVDGQIALLGNRQSELTRVPVGFISGFLYVEPGVHSVAIVPTGKDIGSAIIALDVPLEVGHRYTVAAMGHKEDASFKPLVIDETQAVAGARTSPNQLIMILANNIVGANTLDFLEDGNGPKDVPYGGFVASPIKAGHVDRLLNVVNGDQAIEEFTNFDEPSGIDFLHILNGSFPGAMDSTIFSNAGPYMSDLTMIELLKQMSDSNIPWGDDKLSFNTFLELINKAGLEKTLSSGTYLIFAPTDQTFEALPAGQLDALRSDPESLATYFRNYIVEGYYPYGGLSGATLGNYDATVTTLQGMELKLAGDLSINGGYVGTFPSFTVVNGTRIIPVTKLWVSP